MTVKMELHPWCADAAIEMQAAARGALRQIRGEVEDGTAELFRVTGDSLGWVVTRIEGDELVIVIGVGRNCRPVIEHIVERASARGMTIRTHITRPGLQRIYERCGFFERERVMAHGRR